jgi:UDP-glucose 4-epimerase
LRLRVREEERAMKILFTGGAGFIGSNVVDGYVQAGHETVVVDDLSTGRKDNVHPGARFVKLDIRSSDLDACIRAERPEVINHHAAQISVPASVTDPLKDAEINIVGFLNLLESAVRHGVRKVVFISSGGAVYGEAAEYPTPETCPAQPLSPYAVAKYASEHYLAFYRHQYGLRFTILRYANIYGPRQIPKGEAGVVAIFMDNLLRGAASILYRFPDEEGGMARDYCYVGDVVGANLLALERGDGEIFNIGTGIPTRTLDLYRMIFEAFKGEGVALAQDLAMPRPEPARPGDLKRSCLLVGKARDSLGWSSQTNLEKGLQKTLKWRLGRQGR